MQFIAETSPISKAIEQDSEKGSNNAWRQSTIRGHTHTISKPLMPGIILFESTDEYSIIAPEIREGHLVSPEADESHEVSSSGVNFFGGSFSKSNQEEKTTLSIFNVKEFSGYLFPLKVGNTLALLHKSSIEQNPPFPQTARRI